MAFFVLLLVLLYLIIGIFMAIGTWVEGQWDEVLVNYNATAHKRISRAFSYFVSCMYCVFAWPVIMRNGSNG